MLKAGNLVGKGILLFFFPMSIVPAQALHYPTNKVSPTLLAIPRRDHRKLSPLSLPLGNV